MVAPLSLRDILEIILKEGKERTLPDVKDFTSPAVRLSCLRLFGPTIVLPLGMSACNLKRTFTSLHYRILPE